MEREEPGRVLFEYLAPSLLDEDPRDYPDFRGLFDGAAEAVAAAVRREEAGRVARLRAVARGVRDEPPRLMQWHHPETYAAMEALLSGDLGEDGGDG